MKHGIQRIADAMQECNGAGYQKKRRACRQNGFDQKRACMRHGRGVAHGQKYVGHLRAKALCAPPMLAVGSTNCSAASEANRELTCAMKIAGPARHRVESIVGDPVEGAEEVTSNEMAKYALKHAAGHARKNETRRRQ